MSWQGFKFPKTLKIYELLQLVSAAMSNDKPLRVYALHVSKYNWIQNKINDTYATPELEKQLFDIYFGGDTDVRRWGDRYLCRYVGMNICSP